MKEVDARLGIDREDVTPSAQETQLARAAPVALEQEPPRSWLSRADRRMRRRLRRCYEQPPYRRLRLVALAMATYFWTRYLIPSMDDVRWLFRLNPRYREAFDVWVYAMQAGRGNGNAEAGGRRSG